MKTFTPAEQRAKKSVYMKQYRLALKPFTPEQRAKKSAYMKQYRLTDSGKAYYHRYQRSEKGKASNRRTKTKSTYGITVDEYEMRLAEQFGGCAICGQPQKTRRLPIDHNHTTGQVRGILCEKHNIAVGVLESPDLPAVQAYLTHWNSPIKE